MNSRGISGSLETLNSCSSIIWPAIWLGCCPYHAARKWQLIVLQFVFHIGLGCPARPGRSGNVCRLWMICIIYHSDTSCRILDSVSIRSSSSIQYLQCIRSESMVYVNSRVLKTSPSTKPPSATPINQPRWHYTILDGQTIFFFFFSFDPSF